MDLSCCRSIIVTLAVTGAKPALILQPLPHKSDKTVVVKYTNREKLGVHRVPGRGRIWEWPESLARQCSGHDLIWQAAAYGESRAQNHIFHQEGTIASKKNYEYLWIRNVRLGETFKWQKLKLSYAFLKEIKKDYSNHTLSRCINRYRTVPAAAYDVPSFIGRYWSGSHTGNAFLLLCCCCFFIINYLYIIRPKNSLLSFLFLFFS